MEWTREKTLALIQEYRKRRGLWDMIHEDYRKKDVKQKLLVQVQESLGHNIPITEIEKKFNTLRTQYHREINIMKRKGPYNSKWFGFKYLQFLSSPKGYRSNKSRIKAEITEEGTLTTKYIICEAIRPCHDTIVGSSNANEEFLTVPQISATSSSCSQELEKLIEETTKDVEEIEDAKPKIAMKEISSPKEHQHHTERYTCRPDLEIYEDVDRNSDAMRTQHHVTSNEELHHRISTSANGVSSTLYTISPSHKPSAATTVHNIPARLIKMQRRDTLHDNNEHYEEPHLRHRMKTVSPSCEPNAKTTNKCISYDTSAHLPITITNAAITQDQEVSFINGQLSSMQSSCTNSKNHLRKNFAAPISGSQSITALHSVSSPNSGFRDEFTTYGEYVANEMREIKSCEILLTLKHKINTALFEANMQELRR